MSCIFYIASDFPLQDRPNPYETVMAAHRDININLHTGTIEDGNFDDDFCVWIPEDIYGTRTEKKYFGILEWMKYTEGRGLNFINYLREQMKNTSEIELWHCWLDNNKNHSIKAVEIPINNLKPEHIEELDKKEVWKEPYIHYCYRIIK